MHASLIVYLHKMAHSLPPMAAQITFEGLKCLIYQQLFLYTDRENVDILSKPTRKLSKFWFSLKKKCLYTEKPPLVAHANYILYLKALSELSVI